MPTIGGKRISYGDNRAFRVAGDNRLFTITPTSINVAPEGPEGYKQVYDFTPEESDELFKQLMQSSDQPYFVDSYRDKRISAAEKDAYLNGQQVGTNDLIRADLGMTANPSGKTAAQGAPIHYGDPEAKAEAERNRLAPPINPPEQQGISQQQYQFQPGETPEQYNARIAQLRGGTTQLPSLLEGSSYLVQPGDTLSAIAKKMGVPISSITGYRSGNPNLIYPGEKLQITGVNNPSISSGQMPPQQNSQGQSGGGTFPNISSGSNQPINPPPSPAPTDFIKTYTDTLKQLGIGNIKNEFEKVQKSFNDLQNELNDKIVEINDNPWLSEGIRVSQINKEKERYEGKLNILTNQMKIYDSLYQEGIAQAKFLTTGEIEQQNKAIELAQQRAEADAKLDMELLKLTKKDYESGIIGEYQFAKDNGYQGTFSQYQNEDANRKVSIARSGTSGLTSAQLNSTINSIAGAFDNEQIVKDFNQATSQYQLMSSLGTQSKNPGDDIAFVYAFAKLMDPNSVVREGEYATVQKYAQSFLDAKTLDAIRLAKNTNFLTADAKQKLLTTSYAKMQVLNTQYQNLQNQYQQRIDTVQSGGFNTLPDYSQAFDLQSPTGSKQNVASQEEANKIIESIPNQSQQSVGQTLSQANSGVGGINAFSLIGDAWNWITQPR